MPDGMDYELAGQRHRLLQFHFHTPRQVLRGCCRGAAEGAAR